MHDFLRGNELIKYKIYKEKKISHLEHKNNFLLFLFKLFFDNLIFFCSLSNIF